MASRSQARAEQQAVPSMAPAALMATQSPRPRLGRQPPAFMHVGVRDAKHKFVPRHIYEAVAPRFGNHRFSHLWAERDLGILTPSIASGAWGKVRFLLTEANELLAVKELRTEYKPGFNKLGHTKTQASDLKAAKDEVEFTIKTRRIVDAGLKQALFSRLAVTRSALTPVTISRVITDRIKPKVYVVMNREAGTLEQLKQNIPEALNATLALSFAAQGFAELGLFHDGAHTAHMDLKPDNVLVSQGGQLKLMDLGLAQSLIDNQTPNRGICGSIVSPEMVFSRPEGLPNLGVANDVWAMGVMVVSLAAPAGTPNPFQPSATTLRSAAERDMSYEEHMVQVFTDYSEWYFEHSDAAGNLDVRGIRPDGQGSFSDFFAPLATQNPALCDILFAEVLFITPEDRTGATELGQLIMALLPESPTPAFAALQGAAQDLDKSAGVDALVEHATQYRAWEQVYQSAALASPPPAARGPRPLPG
jgi:serine/threonine protein kinase